MQTELSEVLAQRVRADGPLRFDELVEAALYHPELGFFSRGGGAGRRGDFITSPEVGPLFGAVVARALDRWWRELGEPDPFTVVEVGAGRGALAIAVRAARPDCLPVLDYAMVERSDALRQSQADHLPVGQGDGGGARFASLAEMAPERFEGVVLANELLDNLPFRLLERSGVGWSEVFVAPAGAGGPWEEHLVPVGPELGGWIERLVPGASPGERVPLQERAASWLEGALARLTGGRLVVFDYMTGTEELAAQPQERWIRTYRGHDRGSGPLDDIGEQDVTCEVCLDQLAEVSPPETFTSQASWLREHGIEELVEEGRRAWADRAGSGDLEAMRARSRLSEADALLDPAGLGAFTVAEWSVPRGSRAP